MALPEEFLQRLKDANPIEQVVSSYVRMRRSGKNLMGLCPFHGEKTPSFVLYPENDSFYCFGCHVGGDTITFVRRIENLDYMEAVKMLAQRAGLDMPEDTRRNDGTARIKMRILEANREAARWFHRCLIGPEGTDALAYLRGRKLSDGIITRFGLGYAPDSWQGLSNHLRKLGFTDEELVTANLASRGGRGIYDRFRGRVIFPIIDVRGNVTGFSGRAVGDNGPKYLNTAETLVFEKGRGLFALNFAKNAGGQRLLLAEGPMDVIALHQAGFNFAVATQGTALTQQQAQLMTHYAKEVLLCYDADAAGQKASERAIPILRNAGLKVRVITIPEGKDPDEFIRTRGADRFRQLLDGSGNDVEYRLNKIRAKYDPDSADGRVNILREAIELLADLTGELEADVYAGKLAGEFRVEKATLLSQIDQRRRRRQKEDNAKEYRQIVRDTGGSVRDSINPQRSAHIKAARAEEALIAYLMRNPDRAAEVFAALPAEEFTTDFNRNLYIRLQEHLQSHPAGGTVALTVFSEDHSPDEMSRIAEILAKNNANANNRAAERDYIRVIREEHRKMTPQELAQADDETILAQMEALRRKKQ
ncbi:MAG: DNA primase [Clostridia bacterium]|nr:DNA primase [Clostridia bacterium]